MKCTAILLAAAATTVASAPAMALGLTAEQRQTVADALKLLDFETQTLVPQEEPDGSLRVDLTLGGEPASLLLSLHSIRADEYRVVEVGPDGASRTLPAGPVTTYRGVIAGDPDSRVAASWTGGRLTAWIDTGDALWMTQSIADVLPGVAPEETAVFAAGDIDMSHWFCPVEGLAPIDDIPLDPPISPRGVSECPNYVVTLEMTADIAFTNLHGAQSQSRIEAAVNMVGMIYEQNLSTRVELIGIRRFAGSDPWNVPNDGSGDVNSSNLLNGFDGYIASTPPVAGDDRDFAHLASGREFSGDVVGLAFVGTACSGSATGINQWNSDNTSLNAGILAHEKGHNWGAQHDGSGNPCPTSGFIMSPSICGNCPTHPDQFSSCSIAYITPALTRACVTQFPPALDAFGAVDDAVTIPRGTAHLVDVLANDLVCMNGDRVQVGHITLPASTTAAGFPITVVPGAGPGGRDVVDYAPDPAFSGNDNFTYTLVNGAQSASAFVSITVSPAATVPLCSCDCFTEYRDDAGSSGTIFFGAGVPVNWLNRFNVVAGADEVLQVTLFSNNSGGNTIRFVIWDDPNNDGQPLDAVPIATSPVVPLNASGATSFIFPPTDIGSPGDSFFVGASYVSGEFTMGNDGEPNVGNRSWFSIGGINLSQNGQTQTLPVRLVIRAVGGANLTDCNDNDIVDACDLADYIRPDVNHNGVPDECDPPPAGCPCETDDNVAQVNVFDLLAYLDDWFPGLTAADIDGAPGVNVFDLLFFLDCWFPASAGSPCP